MDMDLILVLVGALTTFVTGLLVREAWPNWIKGVVALGLAAVAGLITVWVNGELPVMSWENLLPLIGLVYMAGRVTFLLVIEQVPGLKEWLLGHGLK